MEGKEVKLLLRQRLADLPFLGSIRLCFLSLFFVIFTSFQLWQQILSNLAGWFHRVGHWVQCAESLLALVTSVRAYRKTPWQ